MPYTVSEPPEKIKDMPKHAIEIWVAAFNAALKEYDGDEGRANAVAYSAVKKAGYEQDENGEWNEPTDRFNPYHDKGGKFTSGGGGGGAGGAGESGGGAGQGADGGLGGSATVESHGTTVQWKSEESVKGNVVLETPDDFDVDKITDKHLATFVQKNPSKFASHLESEDIESVDVSNVKKGKGYITFDVDITPTVDAGQTWLDAVDAGEQWATYHRKRGVAMNPVQELWGKVRQLFEPLLPADEIPPDSVQEQGRAVKDVASWDGAASNYADTNAYCAACLIDVNSAAGRDTKAQSHCMLPVRGPGDGSGTYVRQAVHAAAGGHGVGFVKRPDDVPAEAWDSAIKAAGNKLLDAYGQMKEDAPDSVYKAAGKEPPKRSMAALPIQTRAFTVARQADGKPRWLMIAASAVINKAGSIDSTILFDNFIKHIQEDGEQYPALDFMHNGDHVRFGQADWLRRDGALYLASGTFDDGELGQAAADGLERDPEYWGASIAYRITAEPMTILAEGQIPVYTDGVNKFISIVPKRMACDLFTAALAAEEVQRMRKEDFDELVKLVGEEQARKFAGLVDDTNRTITETGMVVRQEPETPAPPVESAPVQEAPPEPQAQEIPPVAEQEKRQDGEGNMEAQLKSLSDRVAALETQLSELLGSMASETEHMVETGLSTLAERLTKLEKSKAEWLADLPEGDQQRATYRPREAHAPETPQQEPRSTEKSVQALKTALGRKRH